MTTFTGGQVEDFGHGVLRAEGVAVDKDGFVYGGGRNGIIYKVSPDGEVNTLDFLAYLNAWTASHYRADLNLDGEVNTLDSLEFLTPWVTGCP